MVVVGVRFPLRLRRVGPGRAYSRRRYGRYRTMSNPNTNSNDKNNTNQEQTGGGQREGRGGHRRGRKGGRRRSEAMVMTLVFVEKKMDDGRTKRISYVQTEQGSVIVFTKTKQFRPDVGKERECLVWDRSSDRSRYYLAMPTPAQRKQLSPREWLPIEDLRGILVVPLTFRLGINPRTNRKEPVAYHDEQVVKVDEGSDCELDKQAMYLLRESGSICFANIIPQSASSGFGLMRMALEHGTVSIEDLEYVVVKRAVPDRAKMKSAGVREPKGTEHLGEDAAEYRSVYDILSDADKGIVVTAASSAKDLKRAAQRKLASCSPDKVIGDWKRTVGKEPPFLSIRNSELFFEAVQKAADQVKAICEQRDANAKEAAERAAEKAAIDKKVATATAEAVARVGSKASAEPETEFMDSSVLSAALNETRQAETIVAADYNQKPDGLMVSAEDEENMELVEAAAELADLDPEAFVARPRKFRRRFLAQAKADATTSVVIPGTDPAPVATTAAQQA